MPIKVRGSGETDLMGLKFMPLKVKGQAGDRGGAGLADRGAKPMEVGICKCLLAGGPLSRVEGQHALQQPQGTSVRLAEVLLQLHSALLAHVDKEAPRLLISHLLTIDVVASNWYCDAIGQAELQEKALMKQKSSRTDVL